MSVDHSPAPGRGFFDEARYPGIFGWIFSTDHKRIGLLYLWCIVTFFCVGVLLGLLIMGQPFGVVMTGIGVIANAGVIVNNNIVLIDTYDRLRQEGREAYDAIIETCRERARPVVLTAVTAILGVLPIAFGMNLEFLLRKMPDWRTELKEILFTNGDIVEAGEKAEKKVD